MCLGPVVSMTTIPFERPIIAYRAFYDRNHILESVSDSYTFKLNTTHIDNKISIGNGRGFYTLKNLKSVDRNYSANNHWHASVICWGKVIKHKKDGYGEAGYRVQHMRILEIFPRKINGRVKTFK